MSEYSCEKSNKCVLAIDMKKDICFDSKHSKLLQKDHQHSS